MKMLGLLLTIIGSRVVHMVTVSWFTALAMVGLYLTACYLIYRLMRSRSMPIYPVYLMTLGALSNGLVMLANGGVMPAVGYEGEDGMGWRAARDGDRLLFLADRMAWGGWSPGDAVYVAGLVCIAALVLRQAARRVWA